ncbi:MAG: hypothetical protein LBB78_03700 [Spirochaetaceae bacterium]|jgi:hypothetical protein|nr:hypothetical protein [Spirochaetaceae bacterium]
MYLPLLFSSISLILCGFSFVFFRAYLRRRTGTERILGEFREEADKLIAEIDAITDRDAALVGERIKTLRTLLEDVDRRIAVYNREVNREKKQEAAYVELGLKRSVLSTGETPSSGIKSPSPPEVPPEKKGSETTLNQPTPESSDISGVISKPQKNDRNGKGASPGEPRFIRSPIAIQPKPPSFAEQVEKMAGAGLSSELIASRLGTTLAEVDLTIALLHHKQNEED